MGSGIIGFELPHAGTSVSGGSTTTTINITAYGYELEVDLEDDELSVMLEDDELSVELED